MIIILSFFAFTFDVTNSLEIWNEKKTNFIEIWLSYCCVSCQWMNVEFIQILSNNHRFFFHSSNLTNVNWLLARSILFFYTKKKCQTFLVYQKNLIEKMSIPLRFMKLFFPQLILFSYFFYQEKTNTCI